MLLLAETEYTQLCLAFLSNPWFHPQKEKIQDLLAGGSETTATTLQWAMTELMRNPDVMARAQDEVRAAFMGGEEGYRRGSRRTELLAMHHQGDLAAAHSWAVTGAKGVPGAMQNTRL
jgi:hypothetical protein